MASTEKPRVLSGFRPTGPMHVGHLVGALDNWVRLQDSHDCFFVIVDWHALTTHYEDPRIISESTMDMVVDWLAANVPSSWPIEACPSSSSKCVRCGPLPLIKPTGWPSWCAATL